MDDQEMDQEMDDQDIDNIDAVFAWIEQCYFFKVNAIVIVAARIYNWMKC